MSHELRGSGLHVTIVRPGFVPTKMTAGMKPPPLSSTAESVGRAIVDGVDRQAPIVWVPPTFKWVAPVIKAIPRRLFGRLSI
jgi:decaprenylphospho-beta-D-erythro-pentofuranosid-2-ulose 2-reductase